jgi:hypothetical protein
MIYDENSRTMLMFAGMLADRSWPSDTWELRSGGWTRVASDGPPGRGRTALAYDGARKHVVLFGGVGGAPAGQPQPFYGDTWIWENARWRKVAEDGPRGRYAHGMVYDERARAILVYSGAAAHRNAPLDDMWQWNGSSWSQIQLSGATPGFRYQPIMVYDRARSKTVLYGGFSESGAMYDTWEWDGVTWKKIQP